MMNKPSDDRFKTHRFTIHKDRKIHSSQVMISLGEIWLLSAYVALPCEYIYQGCTQRYRDKVGKRWRQGRVLGFYWEATGSNKYYEAWIPGLWHSLCVTIRTGEIEARQL